MFEPYSLVRVFARSTRAKTRTRNPKVGLLREVFEFEQQLSVAAILSSATNQIQQTAIGPNRARSIVVVFVFELAAGLGNVEARDVQKFSEFQKPCG